MKINLSIVSFLLVSVVCSFAQNLSIQVLQQGTSYTDSSFYDILNVGNQYWVGGKYGTLKSMDKEGKTADIPYPNQQLDIYKLDKFDEENIIICGDKGSIYKHNLANKSWETIRVKGYENACFYNMAVVDEKTVYICGGSSAIAHSHKTIPKGFILKSTDSGRTWERVYSNPLKMVWCVKYNPFDKKVYALAYTLNKTHLLVLEDDRWRKKAKLGNSIFHEIQFPNKDEFIATGGWIGKKGRIYSNKEKHIFPHSGLIWGRTAHPDYDIYTASDGQIILADKNGNYKLFHVKLNQAFNIYESVFTSDSTAIAVGSARTILKIKIATSHSEESKGK